MTEARCMKCRAQKEMTDEEPFETKNGRVGIKGKCKECGTGMARILGLKKKSEELPPAFPE